MSIYKPFTTTDTSVTPFSVNKTFTFNGSTELLNTGIDRFTGQNIASSLWISGSNPTGNITSYDKKLIYKSTQELYYSNYISGSNGSPASTASFNPDGTITGGVYTPSYDNYLSTTLKSNRYFPTGSNAEIGIYSIPSNVFGENIKPNTFYLKSGSNTITDNGEGALYYNNSYLVGNIIYEHGMVILYEVPASLYPYGVYGSLIYGFGLYGTPPPPIVNNFILGTNITCSFQSTVTIYEAQYKCNIRQNEFNFSQNPTLVSGSTSDGILYNFATGSYFNPYVTTVGLYNNSKELIAVAKLAQPLPLSSVTDTNIIINLDL